jgi:branched-chain amino acid transport system permease protein
MNWVWFAYSTLGIGCVYAVIALGVVIVYRTNRVLPFHVGQVGIFCAYLFTSLWPAKAGPWQAWLAVAAVVLAAAATGLVMHVLIDRWGARYGHFTGTVVTIAASIFMMGMMSFIWTGQVRRFTLVDGKTTFAGVHLSLNGLFVIAAGVVIVGLMLSWMRYSRIGIDMQAIANNPRLAEFRGIPVGARLITAWIASSLLAAIGGIMMSSLSVVSLEGTGIGISAIIAAILGGMYSMPGAVIGALLLATGENLVTTFFDPRYSQVVPVLLLVILLTLRPSGLSGRVEDITRV